MEFTKQEFNDLRADIKKALAPIEEKYKLDITPAKISYERLSFTMTLMADKTEHAGKPINRRKEEFNEYCRLYGFKPEDYRAKCHCAGDLKTTYLLVEINPANRKYPIILEDVTTGKQIKCVKSAVILDKSA